MKKKNYKKIAKQVIDLEIHALKKLKNSINDSFNQAVNAIVKCQSKTILCGVGKSGLIAYKIAATLSSVGNPSFALWPPVTRWFNKKSLPYQKLQNRRANPPFINAESQF